MINFGVSGRLNDARPRIAASDTLRSFTNLGSICSIPFALFSTKVEIAASLAPALSLLSLAIFITSSNALPSPNTIAISRPSLTASASIDAASLIAKVFQASGAFAFLLPRRPSCNPSAISFCMPTSREPAKSKSSFIALGFESISSARTRATKVRCLPIALAFASFTPKEGSKLTVGSIPYQSIKG